MNLFTCLRKKRINIILILLWSHLKFLSLPTKILVTKTSYKISIMNYYYSSLGHFLTFAELPPRYKKLVDDP